MARAYNSEVRHGVGQTCHKKPIYTSYYFHRNRIRYTKRFLSPKQWIRARQIIKMDLDRAAIRWKEKNDKTRLNYYDRLISEFDF